MKDDAFAPKGKFTALLQSLFAGLFILAAFYLTARWNDRLLIAAVGASAYIMFLTPESPPARPGSILGGYAFGALWGLLCAVALQHLPELFGGRAPVILCALAVFFTALCMKQSRLAHPPAAAMTISVTLCAQPLQMALVAILTAAALVCAREILLRLLAWLNRGSRAQAVSAESRADESSI